MNMKKPRLILGLLLSSALGIAFTGCKKNEKQETAETIISAEDNSTVESEFTSLFDVADDFSSNDHRTRAGNTILPSGAIVIFQDSSYTDGDGVECSIDFGPLKSSSPKGTLCQDGRYRAGVIHITSTKRYFLDSAVVTISAGDNDNFYAGNDGVNLTKVSGTIMLSRLSQSSLKIDVTNAKATNDNGTVTWQSSRTITKTIDNGPGILDDQFTITGSGSGVNRNGESFTVTIDVPLQKIVQMGCARTFIVGKITLTNVTSGKKILIDYDPFSNQACDLVAKATINNKEYFFTVR
jgi:hypothetical protein